FCATGDRFMHIPSSALLFVLLTASLAFGQEAASSPASGNLPAPGSRGNADNVPYIGKGDPQGNPVRLAKATGHVSNYSEDKIPPYTLPDPLLLFGGPRH